VLLVPKELDSAARLGERQTDGSSQANLPLQLFVHAAKERLNLYARGAIGPPAPLVRAKWG